MSQAAIRMVSAWASANELVLGQLATEAKNNEIKAIPKLLDLLDLKDATVTIDAMGNQRKIARKIVDRGGDYVLSLKDNPPRFHEEVKLFLDRVMESGGKDAALDTHEETDGGQGRVEIRRAWVTPAVDWFEDRRHRPGLKSFAAVEMCAKRERQNQRRAALLHQQPGRHERKGPRRGRAQPLGY